MSTEFERRATDALLREGNRRLRAVDPKAAPITAETLAERSNPWQTVFTPESSNVHAISYSEALETLAVAYRPFTVYVFKGFHKVGFERLKKHVEESGGKIGSFLRREIGIAACLPLKLTDEEAAKIPLVEVVPESETS